MLIISGVYLQLERLLRYFQQLCLHFLFEVIHIFLEHHENLKNILSEKDIQRNLDTLIGTQRVRRIGPEILQNNQSHTELPNLPEHLKPLLEKI